MEYIAGVDIGGTKTSVCLSQAGGGGFHICCKNVFETGKNGPADTLDAISENLGRMTGKLAPGQKLSRIGISCGGPLDEKSGKIMSPPNLPGWDNVPIARILEKKFSVPVKLQNDAYACAVAEWRFGAGRGCDDVVFLTFGTGIGAGIILNGKPYYGACGMAGQVGHIRMAGHGPAGYGKCGSLEGFCSGGGIAQLASSMVREKIQQGVRVPFCKSMEEAGKLTAKTVGDAAESGDPLATEIYAECGKVLGRGLAVMVDILNPQVIIIGGIFTRRVSLIWPYARETLEKEALAGTFRACRISPSQLGERLGDISALCAADGM